MGGENPLCMRALQWTDPKNEKWEKEEHCKVQTHISTAAHMQTLLSIIHFYYSFHNNDMASAKK